MQKSGEKECAKKKCHTRVPNWSGTPPRTMNIVTRGGGGQTWLVGYVLVGPRHFQAFFWICAAANAITFKKKYYLISQLHQRRSGESAITFSFFLSVRPGKPGNPKLSLSRRQKLISFFCESSRFASSHLRNFCQPYIFSLFGFCSSFFFLSNHVRCPGDNFQPCPFYAHVISMFCTS